MPLVANCRNEIVARNVALGERRAGNASHATAMFVAKRKGALELPEFNRFDQRFDEALRSRSLMAKDDEALDKKHDRHDRTRDDKYHDDAAFGQKLIGGDDGVVHRDWSLWGDGKMEKNSTFYTVSRCFY